LTGLTRRQSGSCRGEHQLGAVAWPTVIAPGDGCLCPAGWGPPCACPLYSRTPSCTARNTGASPTHRSHHHHSPASRSSSLLLNPALLASPHHIDNSTTIASILQKRTRFISRPLSPPLAASRTPPIHYPRFSSSPGPLLAFHQIAPAGAKALRPLQAGKAGAVVGHQPPTPAPPRQCRKNRHLSQNPQCPTAIATPAPVRRRRLIPTRRARPSDDIAPMQRHSPRTSGMPTATREWQLVEHIQ
jgi:hypothetical protein